MTDRGDCNIPDAFLKKLGDKKCFFFFPDLDVFDKVSNNN